MTTDFIFVLLNPYMKKLLSKFSPAKGFTLIELLVVIAIIGVLAAVLIAVLDPIDKIRLSNDAGVISTIAQLGKSNDAYGVNHNNLYVPGGATNTFAGAVTDLNTAGETKFTTLTAPTGYTYNYLPTTAACTTAASTCTAYVFSVNLLSKKYTATPYYMWSNGKGCTFATAPVLTSVCP